MTEIIAISIHPIVAGNAIHPVGKEMCLGEGSIHFAVAALAGVGCECLHVISMTITTGERIIRRFELMTV